MGGVQISYLIEHPEYIPQLAQWLFEQWGSTLGEKTPENRIKKLKTHMNRNKLPIAWVAHANGQLLGTAALRVGDLEGHEDLTPWLGGVFVDSHFRRQGIGAALCATVEDEAWSRGIQTLYLFTLDKQAWYSRLGWTVLGPCVWQQRPVDIMCKHLQTGQNDRNRRVGSMKRAVTSGKRLSHEPPAVTAKLGWRYHHIGIPHTQPRAREHHVAHLGVHVSGFETSPYGIEWIRFEPHCHVPEIVRIVPHIAFAVDDLDEALKGREILIAPTEPSVGVRVAFILDDGAPVELLQFRHGQGGPPNDKAAEQRAAPDDGARGKKCAGAGERER